jgi:hypothetical protein
MTTPRVDRPGRQQFDDPVPERVGDAPAVVDDRGLGLIVSLGHVENSW